MTAADLLAAATALREFPATVLDSDSLGVHAIGWAVNNVAVFPGWGKAPSIRNPHPEGSPERKNCHGECGLDGHGFYDATTDVQKVAHWWGDRYRGANIIGRVPENLFVLDVDPRSGGDVYLAGLEDHHGRLPETRTHISGRGDGGRHLFFRRPPGKLSAHRIYKTGVDLKTHSGYIILPPSVHPRTRKPYTAIEAPIAVPPRWLVELLRPEVVTVTERPRRKFTSSTFTGPSIADQFSANTSWSDILMPHGWACLDADPDADGARWLHPNATSKCSATIRNSCLFVYSTNTDFGVTEPGNAKGHTKFRAHSILNHGGDMSAAAKALKGVA